jgi:hypothetical protein
MDEAMFGLSEVSDEIDIPWSPLALALVAAPTAWKLYGEPVSRSKLPPPDVARACRDCGEVKPADQFGSLRNGRRRNPRCFPCNAAYQRHMRHTMADRL